MQKNLIIIPFDLDWRWLCDYEIQTAKELAKNNYVIAFIPDSGINIIQWIQNHHRIFRQIELNLLQFCPINIFPFQRLRIIKTINTIMNIYMLHIYIRLQYTWKNSQKILWTFPSNRRIYPTILFHNYYWIYDCVDYVDIDRVDKYGELLHANLIVTPSRSLHNYYAQFGIHTKVVPLGFAVNDFVQKTSHKTITPHSIVSPYVIYIGNINMRISFPYLFSLISSLPKISFVFVGNIDYFYQPHNSELLKKYIHKLKKFPNVHILHSRSRAKMIPLLQKATAALIPFDHHQKRVVYSYPMKTMEYFYFGLPVLSTPIKELFRYTPYVSITTDGEHAAIKLHELIQKPWQPKKVIRQKQVAIANSWKSKIDTIKKILTRTSTIRL